MKETPLHKALEDATRKIAEDPHQQNVTRQLDILRGVALDFHDADVRVTLETRPGNNGYKASESRDVDEDEMLANGAITIGQAKLDFILQKDGYGDAEMSLKIFHGDVELLDQKSDYDEEEKTWTDRIEEEDDEDSDGGYDEDEDYGDDPAPYKPASDKWSMLTPEDDEEPPAPPAAVPKDLKSIVTGLLIDIKAREDFVGRFNIGPNGIPGVVVEKPFPVAAPVKLKKPGKP